MRRIAEARVKTGDFIARLMMAYTGFAAFCVFALLSPDRLMIEAQASLNMPFAGTVSFLAFMVVAPVVLIGMRVYLEVYVQRWRQLDAELDPETEPEAISPLKHPLLRRFSAMVLYFLLTAMLALFTWKAAAKDVWGEVFLLLTVICTAAQVYQFVPRRWSRRAARIAAVSGSLFVFVFVGVLYEWGLPHRGLDLIREDLEGAYLYREKLQGANLAEANLQKADLVAANLQEAHLQGANLQEAILIGANLQKANLRRANLQEANLSFANLQEVDFQLATLQKVDLTQADLQKADLGWANLQEAVLIGANLQEADLSLANLQKAVLVRANLQAANLNGADLREAILVGAYFHEVDLRGAKFHGSNITRADFNAAIFSNRDVLVTACFSTEPDPQHDKILAGPPINLPKGVDPPTKHCNEKEETPK